MAKNKLHIAIIQDSPDIGGAETFIYNLSKQFINKGHKVSLAAHGEKFISYMENQNIKAYRLKYRADVIGDYRGLAKTILFTPLILRDYVRILRKLKKDGVDVILVAGFTEKIISTYLSVAVRLPVVWIEYNPLSKVFKKNFGIPGTIYKLFTHVPKAIIAPSINIQKDLVISARVSPSKIQMIPLGIPIKKAQRRLLKKDSYVIGSVSRLTPEKGQIHLINAMPEVLKEIPYAQLILVGSGPARHAYEKRVAQLRLENSVTFTGFTEDIEAEYDKMDVFAFTSIWDLEAFGLVNIEALAHKLPVVAFKRRPVKEIIDNTCGILIPEKNEKILAKSLIRLGKDPELRKKLGDVGYKKAQTRYNIENVSEKILKILNIT